MRIVFSYNFLQYFIKLFIIVFIISFFGCKSTKIVKKKQLIRHKDRKAQSLSKTKQFSYTHIPEPKIKLPPAKQQSLAKKCIEKTQKKKKIVFAKIKRQKHNILKLPVNILIPPQKNKSLFLSPESFINKWAIIGYFPLHKEDIRPETIHKIFIKNEPYLYELPENIKLIHYLVSDDKKFPGQINSGELMRNKLIGKTEYGVIYAVTEILAPFDMNNITMCTGSDDYIKIWINGELVHTYNRDTRQADWDQDVVNNIRLKKGKNFIVLKQLSFNSKFRFYFRFMTGNGVPIRTKSGINSSKKIKKYKKN